jgi:hypothetical protein
MSVYQNVRTDVWRSKRDCWWTQHFTRHMSTDTKAWSWNKMCVGEICSTASHATSDIVARRELLQRAENDAIFLPSISTEYETCVYGYDPETVQMSRWTTPTSTHPKKARQVRSKIKEMPDRFRWRGGSGASWISFLRPEFKSDCLQNRFATPSRCSSTETAS